MKALTKRKPHKYGSIKECGITELEKAEYRQNGTIRIKDNALSFGELYRLSNHKDISYYDFAERENRNWLNDLIDWEY